jgi:hypothetical protein
MRTLKKYFFGEWYKKSLNGFLVPESDLPAFFMLLYTESNGGKSKGLVSIYFPPT